MKRFRYLGDPLFLAGCACYALNRWWVKPHWSNMIVHNWLNDAWLIPCALPPVLLLHRWLGWRRHDEPPTPAEVFGHLVGWSILFELIGPHLFRHATGDPLDVLSYALGAALGFAWWHRARFSAAAPLSIFRQALKRAGKFLMLVREL